MKNRTYQIQAVVKCTDEAKGQEVKCETRKIHNLIYKFTKTVINNIFLIQRFYKSKLARCYI